MVEASSKMSKQKNDISLLDSHTLLLKDYTVAERVANTNSRTDKFSSSFTFGDYQIRFGTRVWPKPDSDIEVWVCFKKAHPLTIKAIRLLDGSDPSGSNVTPGSHNTPSTFKDGTQFGTDDFILS